VLGLPEAGYRDARATFSGGARFVSRVLVASLVTYLVRQDALLITALPVLLVRYFGLIELPHQAGDDPPAT